MSATSEELSTRANEQIVKILQKLSDFRRWLDSSETQKDPAGELIRLNALMFEGTIHVLGQRSADLYDQVKELTAENARLKSALEARSA